jgi:hypothetical protein
MRIHNRNVDVGSVLTLGLSATGVLVQASTGLLALGLGLTGLMLLNHLAKELAVGGFIGMNLTTALVAL